MDDANSSAVQRPGEHPTAGGSSAAHFAALSAQAMMPGQAPDRPVMIEGRFTHDSLPDLFRFICRRPGTLHWRITTLAGVFVLYFDAGTPIDVMFIPVRPIGARVGMKMLRMLFEQQGGRFQLWDGAVLPPRRSLQLSGEQLLMEVATFSDESTAPGARPEVLPSTLNVDAELELVRDLPGEDHRTAFRTRTSDVPLTEVLQLFSVSRQPYWVELWTPDEMRVGRLHLDASHQVVSVEAGEQQGASAFTALLTESRPCIINVRSLSISEERRLAQLQPQPTPLGLLEVLLMRELMLGHLEPQAVAPLQSAPEGRSMEPRPDDGSDAPARARGLAARLLGRLRKPGSD